MSYFIGIDGGGTKTKGVLVDENNNILADGIGGPSNFLVFDLADVSESIINLVSELSQKSNISLTDVKTILIGTAGAGRKDDAKKLEESVTSLSKEKNIQINNFRVESDARIALEGAFSGKPGSILIAGTGSIMFGKDKDGNIHRVGGFGRQLGDEGSGFHIGRAGLTEVAKSFDGRKSESILTKLVSDKFGLTDSTELINAVYKNNFDIPQVAPLVIKAADKGDSACLNILNNEILEVILHFKSMHNKIKSDVLYVSLIGGIVTTDNFYATLFCESVNKLENIRIMDAELPPEMGAAIMAKEILDA
ncbi:MAG: BadF/BadG/BcrA/BcrD ATPase family protein [Bacteroidota bacterium]